MVADTRKIRDYPSMNNVENDGESVLSTDRKICVPILPSDEGRILESALEYRYRIQGLAREILGDRDKRLKYCLRRNRPGTEAVEVRRDPDAATSHFRNLELCSRVWTCPVCSARIANKRREELSESLAAAKLLGLHAVLVTYTLRHSWRDKLETLLSGLISSLGAFKSGRGWQDIKAEYGIVGGIRVLEPLYGENGWHPHFHELIIMDEHLSPQECSGLRKWLADRWMHCLKKFDLDTSFAYGVHVTNADSKIAAYIAKYGREPIEKEYGIEHEIANAGSKTGSHDLLTPFQLLESYDIGDKRAEGLFIEYAEAMSRRHQLVYSKGLRALLKLPELVADEQLPLIEDEAPALYTAVEIDQINWTRVLLFDLRGALLWLVAVGDWTTLRALLRKYQIHAEIHTEPPAEQIDPLIADIAAARASAAEVPKNILLFDLPPIKARYE